MKIVIGHLYYDLMNLYGEIGNIKALAYHLKEQGIKYEVKNISIEEDINFDELDLIYIGSSTENNREIAFEHLKKYKNEIKEAIENNKFFLITGNALTLFSKEYLGIFDFHYEESKRNVNEINLNYKDKDIYGFINNSDKLTYGNVNNLFMNDGIKYNNFYGTTLIGPLLVRNPEFLKEFIKDLIKSKDKKFKLKKINIKLNELAYDEFMEFKKTKVHIK